VAAEHPAARPSIRVAARVALRHERAGRLRGTLESQARTAQPKEHE